MCGGPARRIVTDMQNTYDTHRFVLDHQARLRTDARQWRLARISRRSRRTRAQTSISSSTSDPSAA